MRLTVVDPFSKFGGVLLQARGREGLQYWVTLPYMLFFVVVAWGLTARWGVQGLIVANYLQVGGWYISLHILGQLDHRQGVVLRTVALYLACGVALAAVLSSGLNLQDPGLACTFVGLLAIALASTVGRPAQTQVLGQLREVCTRHSA